MTNQALNTVTPPTAIPDDLKSRFTLGGLVPVLQLYKNNTTRKRYHFTTAMYEQTARDMDAATFRYYGQTLAWLLQAATAHPLSGLSVCVFGSVSINCDLIALRNGAKHVDLLEYNPPIAEHPNVDSLDIRDVLLGNRTWDVGMSVSSFEHDGLGRYGDPLDPDGDLRAMRDTSALLKDQGLLFLAVPIGPDCLVWNAHRVYGPKRLPLLLEGWETVATYGFSEQLFNLPLGKYKQPVFVLKKKVRQDDRATCAPAPNLPPELRPSLTQHFERLLAEASHIPASTGHAHFTKYPLRLGIIADVYLYNYYKDVCRDVVYLTPGNCREQDYASFDLILYTTCWKGINDEEWRGVKFRERPKLALEHIVSEARRLGIPTVFQSIEDPSNFDYFLPIAKTFDHIFTTDTDCIPRYRESLGHARVHFGEYGFNPAVNNPIGCRRNIRNAAFFAGSYATRYSERCTDMATLFGSILQSGGNLVIADRNYGTTATDLAYPEPYRHCLVPAIEHELLQKVHKLFRYNLTFNSITQSPSMCAMRTYELQAMGCGIISNYARSVYNLFPNLRIIPTHCDLTESFAPTQSWEEFESICRNIRRVFAANASFTVFGKMLRAIGLSTPEASLEPSVAVFCDKITPRISECFEKQTHPTRRLIEKTNRQGAPPKLGNFTHFCWFSDQETYEPHYLEDMLNVFKFTDASFATKHSYFDHTGSHHVGPEHEFTGTCAGKQRSLFRTDAHPVKQLWSALAEHPFALRNGYATDPFSLNFDQHLRARLPQQSSYELSLIVPVHNNGAFLEGKCFPSILRNKQWPQFEIILVDDASSAPDTQTVLRTLEARYANVKVLRHSTGPSGSASVPRNLGMAAATAPLLSFLDPDNEISPGGYDTLLDLFRTIDQESPLLSAYNVKVGSATTILAKRTKERLVTVPNPKLSYLESGNFPVVATQAAVISASFLRNHGITFVEGSAGQDTLFGWELLANAPTIAFTGSAFLIYYADRIGSITNVPDKAYFKKHLMLEVAQQRFLTAHGLLSIYRHGRFGNFMRAWYFKLLERAPQRQRAACLKILREIASLYGATIRAKHSHLELQLEGADLTPNHHE